MIQGKGFIHHLESVTHDEREFVYILYKESPPCIYPVYAFWNADRALFIHNFTSPMGGAYLKTPFVVHDHFDNEIFTITSPEEIAMITANLLVAEPDSTGLTKEKLMKFIKDFKQSSPQQIQIYAGAETMDKFLEALNNHDNGKP